LHHCWPGTGHWDRPEVALFDISIPDIGCRYIDTFKNIDIDIDIDKVLNQLEFGISNRASQRGIDHCKMGGPSKRTAAQN